MSVRWNINVRHSSIYVCIGQVSVETRRKTRCFHHAPRMFKKNSKIYSFRIKFANKIICAIISSTHTRKLGQIQYYDNNNVPIYYRKKENSPHSTSTEMLRTHGRFMANWGLHSFGQKIMDFVRICFGCHSAPRAPHTNNIHFLYICTSYCYSHWWW